MKKQAIRIQREEFRQRVGQLLRSIREQNLRGVVLFDSVNILYFTGFAFIPTERLIAFVISASGERAMVVPRLELEHAQVEAELDRVAHYPEYPGNPHPTAVLQQMLVEMDIVNVGEQIGADMNGYPWIFGYEGAALDALTGMKIVNLQRQINRQHFIG